MTGSEDQRLQALVEHRLAEDMLIDESQVDVAVSGSVVTVMGTVGSYGEKVMVQHAAHSVDGVHDMVNAIVVKPVAVMNPTDAELAEMVHQVLAWNALVPEDDVEVSVSDGLVALTGTCLAAVQATEAERAVSRLNGVRGVLNRIVIAEPELRNDDIHLIITEVLERRAKHQASQIDVIVERDAVTLTGRVQSEMERRAIVGAVSHGLGVSELRDELKVITDWTE